MRAQALARGLMHVGRLGVDHGQWRSSAAGGVLCLRLLGGIGREAVLGDAARRAA